MRTIHIQGYADEIDLLTSVSDNYDFPETFSYEESSTEKIPNTFFRFYECDKPCSLETALEEHVLKMFGVLSAEGQATGYSEYTIDGFAVTEMKLGGHDLAKIIKAKGHKYLHILMDFDVKADKK